MTPLYKLLHAVVGALAWFIAAWSHADVEFARVALAWQTPADGGCATQEEIQDEVARLTEREPATRGQSFKIEAMALLHDERWVASVALRDAGGRILGGREVMGDFLHLGLLHPRHAESSAAPSLVSPTKPVCLSPSNPVRTRR